MSKTKKKDELTTLTIDYEKFDIKDPANSPEDLNAEENTDFLPEQPALVTD